MIFPVKPSRLMSVILILLQLFSFRIIPGPPRVAIAICSGRTAPMPSEFPSHSDFPFFSSHLLELQVGFANVQFTYFMPNNNSKLLFFSTACYRRSLWLQKFWNENFKNISFCLLLFNGHNLLNSLWWTCAHQKDITIKCIFISAIILNFTLQGQQWLPMW